MLHDDLDAILRKAGIPNEGVSQLQPEDPVQPGWEVVTRPDGLRFRVDYLPSATPAHRTQAASLILAFDPSDLLTSLRNGAKDVLDNDRSPLAKLIRGGNLVTMDEINLLRAQVVGVAQFQWDPASMANGATVLSSVVAVPNAALGDKVIAEPRNYSSGGVTINAYVSTPGNALVRLINHTGATVNFPLGPWGLCVLRYTAMPLRTVEQIYPAIRARIDTNEAN